MNLSDLITAAPEATTSKGPGVNAADGERASAEAGEFLSLTQSLSDETPEDLEQLETQADIQDASALKNKNTVMIVETRNQDFEVTDDPVTGTVVLSGDAEADVPVGFAGNATSSGLPLETTARPRLSDANKVAETSIKTGEQLQPIIDKPFGSDGPVKETTAPAVQTGSVPTTGVREAQPHLVITAEPAQTVALVKSLPAAPSVSIATEPDPSKTHLRPVTRDNEALLHARTDSAGITMDRESSTARVTDVLRSLPELSTAAPASASNATEPRVFQFLNTQGVLQPLGSESLFANGQSVIGSPTVLTSVNSVVAGALSSEVSTQAAQRSILPQIVGSMQTIQNGGVIDLMLDPPELGRIEILIELSDKSLRATLSAERSGTGDLMRRHADDLMQQLSDAGFADVDLNFAEQREGSAKPDVQRMASDHPHEETSADIDNSPKTIALNGHGRVDLRL